MTGDALGILLLKMVADHEARANAVELDGTSDKLYSVSISPRSFTVLILTSC